MNRRLLLLAAFSFISFAQQSNPSIPSRTGPGSTGQKSTEQRKNDTDSRPSSITPTETITANRREGAQKTGEEQQSTSPNDNWSVVVAIAAVATALAAVAQAIIYGRQTRLIKQGLTETRRTASAAESSAKIAEMSLKLAQRADVLMDSVSIADPNGYSRGQVITPGGQVKVAFKNFGSTRAENVIFDVGLSIPGVPSTNQDMMRTPDTLGPGDTQTVTFVRFGSFLNKDVVDAINEGRIVMRVVGKVMYNDVFGQSYSTPVHARFSPEHRVFMADGNESAENNN